MPTPDTERTPSRALIVIDVQNDYDGGNLPIAYPPFHDSIRNVARAMDAARAAGIRIVVIRHVAPDNAPVFAPGSRGAELHDAIRSRTWDHLVEKQLPSAFA